MIQIERKDMNLKELSNIMLKKRFREQILFGRFGDLPIADELIERGCKEDVDRILEMAKQLKCENR